MMEGQVYFSEEGRRKAEKIHSVFCPICGQNLDTNFAVFIHTRDASEVDMPPDLSEALIGAGYEPSRYYIRDGQIDTLAVVKDENGKVFAKLHPARDRGQFGGWLIARGSGVELWEVADAIDKYGWTWPKWIPERFKAVSYHSRPAGGPSPSRGD